MAPAVDLTAGEHGEEEAPKHLKLLLSRTRRMAN